MAAGFSSGRSTQLRIIRRPIAVRVRSSTQSRLPFFSCVRLDATSSRLRMVCGSSSMQSVPELIFRLLIWLRSVFCVSSR